MDHYRPAPPPPPPQWPQGDRRPEPQIVLETARHPRPHLDPARRVRQNSSLGIYIAFGLIAHALILTAGGYAIYRAESARLAAELEQSTRQIIRDLEQANQAPRRGR